MITRYDIKERINRLKEYNNIMIQRIERKRIKDKRERNPKHEIKQIIYTLLILFIIPFIIVSFLSYCLFNVKEWCIRSLCPLYQRVFRFGISIVEYMGTGKGYAIKKNRKKNRKKIKAQRPLSEPAPMKSDNKYARGGLVQGKTDPDIVPVWVSPGSSDHSHDTINYYGQEMLDALHKTPVDFQKEWLGEPIQKAQGDLSCNNKIDQACMEKYLKTEQGINCISKIIKGSWVC